MSVDTSVMEKQMIVKFLSVGSNYFLMFFNHMNLLQIPSLKGQVITIQLTVILIEYFIKTRIS